jgi:hypothetical protein
VRCWSRRRTHARLSCCYSRNPHTFSSINDTGWYPRNARLPRCHDLSTRPCQQVLNQSTGYLDSHAVRGELRACLLLENVYLADLCRWPESGEGTVGEGTDRDWSTVPSTTAPLTCTCVHEYINRTGSSRFHGTERGSPGGDADRRACCSRHECRSMMFDV